MAHRPNGTPSLCRLRCSATRTCRSVRQPRSLGITEYSFSTVPLGLCPLFIFMMSECFSSTVEYHESCDRQHAAPSTGWTGRTEVARCEYSEYPQHAAPSTGYAAQLPSSCGGHEGRAGVPSPHPPARPGPLPACPLLPLSHTRRHAHSHSHAHVTQMQRMAVSLNRRSHSLDVCLPSATLGLVMLACVGNGPHSAAPWLHDL